MQLITILAILIIAFDKFLKYKEEYDVYKR